MLRGKDAEERLSIIGDVEDLFDVQNESIKFALTHQFGSEQQHALQTSRIASAADFLPKCVWNRARGTCDLASSVWPSSTGAGIVVRVMGDRLRKRQSRAWARLTSGTRALNTNLAG